MIALPALRLEGTPTVNTAATAVKPGYTPSLLDLMPVPKYTGPAWIAYCDKAVRESRERRKGVKSSQTGIAPVNEPVGTGFWAAKRAAS